MATLFIPHQLRDFTAGLDRLEIPEGTLRQALRALENDYPEFVAHIRKDDGLTPGLAASIDGNFAARGLLARIGPTSEVHLLPAVGGG
ncbi:MAG: MoaD/ThiS family protein [Pirellulales bacterium]